MQVLTAETYAEVTPGDVALDGAGEVVRLVDVVVTATGGVARLHTATLTVAEAVTATERAVMEALL